MRIRSSNRTALLRAALFVALSGASTLTWASDTDKGIWHRAGRLFQIFDHEKSDVPKTSINPKCEEIKIGFTRFSPKNVDGFGDQFAVSRDNQISYTLKLNLKFEPTDGASVSDADAVRNRVQQCFSNTGYLPVSTGDQLRLMLVDANSAIGKRLQPNVIEVVKYPVRESSKRYSVETTACQKILHEALHLTGLWDEYGNGEGQEYPCRVNSQSIMGNIGKPRLTPWGYLDLGPGDPMLIYPFLASNSATEFQSVERIVCAEDASTTEHLKWKRGAKNLRVFEFTEVPSSTQLSGMALTFQDDWDLMVSFSSEEKKKIAGGKLFVPTSLLRDQKPLAENEYLKRLMYLSNGPQWICKVTPQRNPISLKGAALATAIRSSEYFRNVYPLNGVHLRKILNAGCRVKTHTYDLCTSEAYLTPSKGHTCVADRNPICANGSWLN